MIGRAVLGCEHGDGSGWVGRGCEMSVQGVRGLL
jgi:hypothetical protein